MLEQGPGPLGKFPVKCCVVGNDDIRVGDDVFKRGIVDPVPCNHRIRDVGQLDDSSGIAAAGWLKDWKMPVTPVT
jgi:hypothetical protein